MRLSCCWALMERSRRFLIFLMLTGTLTAYQFKAQQSGSPSSSAPELDALLQDYAYRAFVRPRTGVIYSAEVPANMSGIKVSVVRLRSGSLRTRGIQNFNEFDVPPGVIVSPYARRIALVYQNLGNWTSFYYPLPGYTYLTPVIGLLTYSASNLSAKRLPELQMIASAKPISIKFTGVNAVVREPSADCVYFQPDGSHQISDLISGSICMVNRQGHYAIVSNTTELAPSPSPATSQSLPPAPPRHAENLGSNTWKIVVGVIGGFLALVVLLLLFFCLQRHRRSRKMADMLKHSEAGEVLKTQRIGDSPLPVAPMVRTRPTLENEYLPEISTGQ